MTRQIPRLLALTAMLVTAATAAQAHHPLDGAMPTGFMEGLLSGLAHPVIGLDHLAFIVAAGVVAGAAGLGLWLPVLFVAVSILGVVVHLQAIDLPLAELVIAASVVLAGVLLARGKAAGPGLWAVLVAVAGLFHGYAYGESIVGVEPTTLWAYLGGLAVVQSAIGVGAAMIVADRAWTVPAVAPRLVGAAVFGIGISALAGQLIPG